MKHIQPCTHCHGSGIEPQALDPQALVAAIAREIGAETFSVHDLVNYAGLSRGALHDLLSGREPRVIGWVLRAASQRPLDGYRIERLGMERNRTALWRLSVL